MGMIAGAFRWRTHHLSAKTTTCLVLVSDLPILKEWRRFFFQKCLCDLVCPPSIQCLCRDESYRGPFLRTLSTICGRNSAGKSEDGCDVPSELSEGSCKCLSFHFTPKTVLWYIHTYIRTYIHTYLPTYIHTYIHTYVHTYIHTYLPTYIHTYLPTYIHTYLRTYIHTYTHTYLPTYLHTYIHTYAHTYIHTYVHTYIHTYLPTYIHTYLPTYIHTYLPTYIHTYIPTYLHTYIHTYVRTYVHTYIHTVIYDIIHYFKLRFSQPQHPPTSPNSSTPPSTIRPKFLARFIPRDRERDAFLVDSFSKVSTLFVSGMARCNSCRVSVKLWAVRSDCSKVLLCLKRRTKEQL